VKYYVLIASLYIFFKKAVCALFDLFSLGKQMIFVKKKIGSVTNIMLIVVAFLVMFFLVFIFYIRELVLNIDQHRASLEAFLMDRTGARFHLGPVSAKWTGLIPIIEVESVFIGEINAPALIFTQWRADIDPVKSIQHRSLIWREFSINQVDISLEEDKQGFWQLNELSAGGSDNLRMILEPLAYSKSISIDHLNVDLNFYSGDTSQFKGNKLKLENDLDFHRLEFSLLSKQQEASAYIFIEGFGDPLNSNSFSAEGYLSAHKFEMSAFLAHATKRLVPGFAAVDVQDKIMVDGEIWFEMRLGGNTDFRGHINTSSAINNKKNITNLRGFKTNLTGWYFPGEDWGIRLQDLQISVSNKELEPLNLLFKKNMGARWQDFRFFLDGAQLDPLLSFFESSFENNTPLSVLINRLEPKGEITALVAGKDSGKIFADATFKEFSSSSFKGIPGIQGLDAKLSIRGKDAVLRIAETNGFLIDFPNIFADSFPVLSLQGNVFSSWDPTVGAFVMSSDLLSANLDAGHINLQFSTRAEIPDGNALPDVHIVIDGHDIDTRYWKKYLPEKVSPPLKKWLERSILETTLREFTYALRIANSDYSKNNRTNQIFFRLDDTNFKFHPEWLVATEARGLVLIDDDDVFASIEHANLGGTTITNAQIEFRGDDDTLSPQLDVDLHVNSSTAAAIEVIGGSPLKRFMGDTSDWHYGGRQESRIQLSLPITGEKSSSLQDKSSYRVHTSFYDGVLAVPNSSLEITEINGDLFYTSDYGFSGDNLSGIFWGERLNAAVSSDLENQKVKFEGFIQPEKISQLIPFAWEELMHGKIKAEGVLTIPLRDGHSGTKFRLSSNLEGVAIMLPEPIGKTKSQLSNLEILLDIDHSIEELRGSLGEEGSLEARFIDGVFDSGVFNYGRTIEPPPSGTMLFSGYLPHILLESWTPLADLLQKSNFNSETWQSLFDLKFDSATLAGVTFSDVHARAERGDQSLNISFNSAWASGYLSIPDAEDRFPKLFLDNLDFGRQLLKGGFPKGRPDPKNFPNLDIKIDHLIVSNADLGQLEFQLRSEVSGAAFAAIKGNLLGLEFGADDTLPPLDFFWGHDLSGHFSRLIGPASLSDVGNIFEKIEFPRIASSQSGRLTFNLNWPTEPWNFSRKNIAGDFKFSLSDGTLYRSNDGADAALKMISLMNFANWLRRLQLDFSDVVGQDLAYDNMSGLLVFENGIARLDTPLKMEMPSGRMAMTGNFDLLEENIDGRLVATLPVAPNLPWVGALVGGLPAALGVYVTGKLVETQVDRLSSISYSLTGPWDKIDVQVDRIFASGLAGDDHAHPPLSPKSE
tara:strand:- start:21360 stop:25331 length:3972 start_codon:yes stop_codon:yes gene_type:complete